ncbi:MAG TPA: D-alanyl-D-alanine carboxypeptidase/D-alanyl-D-alanine-endopeptidase [Nitrospinota bacterium]|jgi:D-alanyl-D-alanine carboxypeptidase/D-alanyl-D-alanine-endopeptidase (penicillin-binding protein 4)|nr:D-alanyl-D-alanine carboxypeptidase/D-alanyl-D-alanine-endopeptidase [Nitrospinota bacterium]
MEPADPGHANRRRRAIIALGVAAAVLLPMLSDQAAGPAFAQTRAASKTKRRTPPAPRGIPSLKRKMARRLRDACVRKNRVGIRAFSLKSRRVLFDLRGEEQFIPASNVKVLTTATAFHYLKPDYKFKTNVYTTGRFSAGRLSGSLYLKGFGDPSLVNEELWILVRTLKRRGLREVRGDIVVDDRYFDGERFVPGTNGGRGLRPFQAPHGAASLNFNTLGVYVEPNAVIGKPPRAVVEPVSSYIQLINNANTVSRRHKAHIRLRRAAHADGDLIILEGRIPAGSPPRRFWINITTPTLYLGHTFREFLEWEGIKVNGEVRRGKTPPASRQLASHMSKPLAIILWDLNKWSNNFIAEQVLKTLGAEILGAPGTRRKGLAVVNRYMKRLGYGPGSFAVDDGAGLSRKNRISPAQLVRVLTDMYDDIRFRPEFVASLAVMGVDGSVKNRLDDTPAERRIRAKTGTLNGVDTLSGYAFSLAGDVIAFSILMNGSRCSHWRMRRLQDQITLDLVRLDRRAIARKKPSRRRTP